MVFSCDRFGRLSTSQGNGNAYRPNSFAMVDESDVFLTHDISTPIPDLPIYGLFGQQFVYQENMMNSYERRWLDMTRDLSDTYERLNGTRAEPHLVHVALVFTTPIFSKGLDSLIAMINGHDCRIGANITMLLNLCSLAKSLRSSDTELWQAVQGEPPDWF